MPSMALTGFYLLELFTMLPTGANRTTNPLKAAQQHGSGTDTRTGERNVADHFWVSEHWLSA